MLDDCHQNFFFQIVHESYPDVNTTFDILGRQLAITQTAIKMLGNVPTYPVRSQIEYSYADGTGGDHGISSETISYDFNLDGSFELTRVLDRADRSFGRDMGFTLGTAENHASDQSVSYGYNNAGNVNGVTGAGKVFTYGYAYAQAAGAPRVGVAADPEGAINDFKPYALAAPKHTVIRTYEATRDVLVSIDNKIGTSVSYYIYGVNNLGQRETLNTTGPAFSGLAPNHNWAWQYDALGQITTATCGWDSDLSRTYTFDDIGNRLTATTDSGEDAATTTYTPNSLNQYISINPGTAVTPAYDNDGNLYTDAAVNAIGLGLKFKWDGENRLTAVCKDDEGSTLLASYAYDPIGRRIRKTITSASIQGPSDTAYAYDGWNVVAEYAINGSSATLTQAYTWGLDLSGSLQGAGGVGGLLCIHRGPGTATNGDRTWTDAFYPTFDGNGNVSEYFDKDGTQVAHFEYDPFGRIVNSTGSPENFPYRFSTKPQDFETGLFYYGYRYYNPLTGRWPSRDPISEPGGMNLYGFVGNNGISYVDGDGRINLPGIFIGVGWELTIQITANVASGEDWYKIDVTDVVVAGAIGAFFPGAGDVLKGVTKGLAKQGKAIKAGAKALARAKGNLRKWKLAAKAKAAAEAEAEAWKDVAKIGAGVVAGKVAGKAANAAADAIEEQFQGDCPPEINEDGIVTLPPLYILLDSESGKVIDVSEISLGGRPIDPNNPPPFLIPDP